MVKKNLPTASDMELEPRGQRQLSCPLEGSLHCTRDFISWRENGRHVDY